MQAISNRHPNRLFSAIAGLLLSLDPVTHATAHPMPNSEITISRNVNELNFVIRLPAADLLLVLPQHLPRDAEALLEQHLPELRNYFKQHTRLVTEEGRVIPITIGTFGLNRRHNPQVGSYDELEVAVSAQVPVEEDINLDYDGLLHKIANHRVLVQDDTGRVLGVIRNSLSDKAAVSLSLPSTVSP